MNTTVLIDTLYTFTNFLIILIFVSILCKMLRLKGKVAAFIDHITAIILDPIRWLLNKSVIKSNVIDLSPLVAYAVITAIQQILISLRR